MSRKREMLVRQWGVFEALRARRRGLSVPELIELTGASRATVYRDLDLLAEAGVPLTRERIEGEVRHRLLDDARPPLALAPAERAALALARGMLESLEGTRLVDELDALLRRLRGARPPTWVSLADPAPATDRGALRAIDLAIRDGHRLAFDYHPAGGEIPARRRVDPCSLRLYRNQPYLVAFDLDRDDYRIFKVSRIEGDLSLEGPADPHPDYDEASLFAHSVGIWSGDPIDVAICLSPAVAPRAAEYPLTSDQTVEHRPDGSALVRARVAGTQEVLRWTLAWGADAEVLEPEELRERVERELRSALHAYCAREDEA